MTSFEIQGTDVAVSSLLELQMLSTDLRRLKPRVTQARRLGEQRSRIRGEGREFAEMKPYFPGEDVRRIDWRLTARKQSPYARVMEEDRHHEHLIWLPLSARHFFGTRRCFKSVLLCHWAAFLTWRFVQRQHPVQLIIEVGDQCQWTRRVLTQRHAAEACRLLVGAHAQLAQNYRTLTEPDMRNHPAWSARPTLWLLSDFSGQESDRCQAALRAQPVASLMYLMCSDPFDHALPDDMTLPVRSGQNRRVIHTRQLTRQRPNYSENLQNLQQTCRQHQGDLIQHGTNTFSWQEVQQWPLYH